jgi:Cytochrome B6-F complex subunit VI (PetL)
MTGAIIYIVYLGAMVGIALALFFGLRATKII